MAATSSPPDGGADVEITSEEMDDIEDEVAAKGLLKGDPDQAPSFSAPDSVEPFENTYDTIATSAIEGTGKSTRTVFVWMRDSQSFDGEVYKSSSRLYQTIAAYDLRTNTWKPMHGMTDPAPSFLLPPEEEQSA